MRLGFIGCGNMAFALLNSISAQGYAKDMICYDISADALKAAKERFGVTGTDSNQAVAAESDVLVLAVKPRFYDAVIDEIKGDLKPGACVVTIAPGKSLLYMERAFGDSDIPVIRAMPNTPAMVGEGMTALCQNEAVSHQQMAFVQGMFDCCGKTEQVPEYMMEAVVAVSGSSPAYIYMLIEAMADGAVAQGMPRKQAYAFAAQAVLGSAKMVLETGKHPGELKDMVCSPGGTTIVAVEELEAAGFRSAILKAMRACADKAGE